MNVVDKLSKLNNKKPSIYEMGFGSGAISLSIEKLFKNYKFKAIEKNPKTYKCAKINLQLFNSRIDLINEDFFQYKETEKFDIFISNPPYVLKNENVNNLLGKHEDSQAIFIPDRIDTYFLNYFSKLKKILKNEFIFAYIEINQFYANEIMQIAKLFFDTRKIYLVKDLSNNYRFIVIE